MRIQSWLGYFRLFSTNRSFPSVNSVRALSGFGGFSAITGSGAANSAPARAASIPVPIAPATNLRELRRERLNCLLFESIRFALFERLGNLCSRIHIFKKIG